MPSSENFQAVKDFCGQEEDLYWEIIQEIEISINNLLKTIDVGSQDLDQLKFIAHKMKSTFRILKDEAFKDLLDDYVIQVEKGDQPAVSSGADQLGTQCKAYTKMLKMELGQKP